MNNGSGNDILVELKGLKTHFYLQEGVVRAVDGVDLAIRRGKTMGVIGESGCGKSVTAQSIMRIVPTPPGKIVGGEILYYRRKSDGRTVDLIDIAKLERGGDQIRQIRGGEISMIFQEPMTSFGPMHTIGNQIMETIILHQDLDKKAARELAIQMLGYVGIARPGDTIDAYPHQLSGGMRQRAMIAMALSCNPHLLIADEPTTALDVTIQAQILDLLIDMQKRFNMAIMFITHNLGVIAEISDEVAVMYLGMVVEQSNVYNIFDDPKHPYTQGLMKSIPHIVGKRAERLATIEGVVPDPYEIPPGCPFSDRCQSFMPGVCNQAMPDLVEVAEDHLVRCFLYSSKKVGSPGLPVESDEKGNQAITDTR